MATALYRRYRPETFAEVIGQEHVTDPLRAALRSGRVGQAYLFSGPRGCGKTTSARILARCLNCAQGPTDTPCGTCDSCVELARGGPGSLDVVEIDAASHGGVDDARELRERATFAPARDRLKIFIIDEAHMVSSQGFNALLKIVEEPPPHIVFLFATTEPDKVLGTIRSRTHHYPFRLVPPQVLQTHLQQVCDAEGVAVGTGVLPLVVRAGAGSVRDSLSVLDQLAAGAGDGGIDYEGAVALLGYTHATLLDDVTAAFAAGDGATVFHVVDRVISSGQDPRRFVDDLLQRLRDLVVVLALGDRAGEVFPGLPADQLERMALQAAGFGAAQLSRAADLANAAATEMTGATSPRLHLELLCARMLLPAADDAERGLAARLDRVERRLSVPGQVPASGEEPLARRPERPAPLPGAAAAGVGQGGAGAAAEGDQRGAQHVREAMARRRDPSAPAEASAELRSDAVHERPAAAASPPPWDTAPQADTPPEQEGRDEPSTEAPRREARADGSRADGSRADEPRAGASRAESAPEAPSTAPQPAAAPGDADEWGDRPSAPPQDAPDDTPPVTVPVSPDPVGGPPAQEPGGLETTEAVRRMWPDVLEHLATVKRRTWTRVSQDAQVAHVDDQRLVLQFARPNTLQAFSIGPHADFVRESLIAVLGLDRVVVAVNAGAPLPQGAGGAPSRPPAQPAPPSPQPAPSRPDQAPRDQGDARSAPREQPVRDQPGPGRSDDVAASRPAAPPAEAVELPGRPEPRQEPEPRPASGAAPRGRDDAGSGALARQRTRQRGATPPPWDDVPPPEPPDDGEPPPPEFDDPWTAEGPSRSARSAPQAPSAGDRSSGASGASSPAVPVAAPATQTPPPVQRSTAPAAPAPSVPASPDAPVDPPRPAPQGGPLRGADLARSAMRARSAPVAGAGGSAPSAQRPDDEISRDDPDAEGSGQVGLAVVERVLGGRVLSVDERS